MAQIQVDPRRLADRCSPPTIEARSPSSSSVLVRNQEFHLHQLRTLPPLRTAEGPPWRARLAGHGLEVEGVQHGVQRPRAGSEALRPRTGKSDRARATGKSYTTAQHSLRRVLGEAVHRSTIHVVDRGGGGSKK